MKTTKKPEKSAPKTARSREKARENNPVYKAALKSGLDPIHPFVPETDSRDLVASIDGVAGGFKRPAPDPQGWVACGACRHSEAHAAKFVCRSLISPRAGFAHERKFACGYGRARELVGA